jgi:hypothetical protein
VLTVVKSLDALIDDTLQEVAQYDERGYRVQLDGTGLPATNSNTLSLVNAERVSTSDVIEFGDELVLVTDVSAAATPVVTVARGYDGTTPAVHAGTSLGLVNPQFARARVGRALQTAMTRLDAARIFIVKAQTFSRTPGLQYIVMPEDCRQVIRVGVFDESTGRFEENVDGWRFFDNLPTTNVSTGKIVRVPRFVMDDDELAVTYRSAYRWSTYPNDPDGPATITLPEGAQDLPALYAAARLCSHREMSRIDLDRSEEWSKSQSVVQGVTSGIVRQMWQEFYKALAEAQSLNPIDIPRPYVPKRRFL